MKKKDVVSLVTWIIIFGLLIVYSVVSVRSYAPKSGLRGFEFVAFFFASLAAGVFVNSFIFEFAHCLGAKIGHYKITRVNVLRMCVLKENGKKKLVSRKFDGLTGETRIIPDEKSKKTCDPKWYATMPAIFMLIEICIVVFLYSFLTKEETNKVATDWGQFVLTTGIVGFAMLLYDIVPFEMDVMTDGYRLRLISNKKNKDKINQLLCDPDYAIKNNGKEDKIKEEIYSSDTDINNIYKDLKNNNFVEANKKIKAYTKSLEDQKANARVLLNAKIFEIYTNLMHLSKTEACAYYEKDVPYSTRRDIADEQSILGISAYILMSGLMDKSRSECLYSLKNIQKAYKHCPAIKKELEKDLFNAALNKICIEHPNWELEQYKL